MSFGQLGCEDGMPDDVESFGKVKRYEKDILVVLKEGGYMMEHPYQGLRGRSCGGGSHIGPPVADPSAS